MSVLHQAAVFLGAAVIAVPLSKRLGLGSVLGYLAAGIVLGPWGLALFEDVEAILHASEFGVVLLLFIIGLELQPRRLWVMRKQVFGLGGTQVGVTAAAIALVGYGLGLELNAAIAVGLALSLSSTAFALQTLAERGEVSARHGRSAFAILLFQDMAAIPMIAMIPLMGIATGGPDDGDGWSHAIKVVAVFAGVILGGHYLLRHVLRALAKLHIHEIFTAMGLFMVIGTSLLMDAVGISMALGAFLAGVLLADSEYRHELEANIEPFKNLLLGLFFIAVGMSVNVGLLVDSPLTILALVVALVAGKAAILFFLGWRSGLSITCAQKLALSISQGGEFAFVILGVAITANVVDRPLSDLLILVVTLSMATTPLLLALNDRLAGKGGKTDSERPAEEIPEAAGHVIIAGFGRFGQIIGRILRAKGIHFTAIENSSERIDFVSRFGNKVYYGDASRLELLRAAGAHEATALVLAMDDVEATVRAAELAKRNFPNLRVFARARDRQHAYRLMDTGLPVVWRETYLTCLDMARVLLCSQGVSPADAERDVARFREHDEHVLYEHQDMHKDEEKMAQIAMKTAEELEALFERDIEDVRQARPQANEG